MRSVPLLAVLAVLLARPALAGGDSPTLNYRDPNFKYSLKVFRDWPQVPTQPGEELIAAQWYEEGGGAAIRVLRFERAPTVTGGEQPLGPPRPKDLWEVLERRGVVARKTLEDAEHDDIKSRDKVEGRYWEFDASPYRAIAWFQKDLVEYVVLMECDQSRMKSFRFGFKSVARSFRFFDDKAKDAKSQSELDEVNLSDERREEIEGGLVRGWDIEVSPKQQYVVIYNTKGKENTYLAKFIAKRIEQIREDIYEVQFPPSEPVEAVSIVRICGDRDEYMAYGGMQGSAGYWNSQKEELVFYDAGRSRKPDDNTIAVLYHEAFHQFIFYSVGNVAPHSWFNEGHGDYYAGAVYKSGKFRIEPFDWRVPVVKKALSQGVRAGNSGSGYVPLKDLVAYSQGEYYSYPSVCYAQGWSLIYFLREIVPKKKKYPEEWEQILPRYFDTLKAEVGAARRGGPVTVPQAGGAAGAAEEAPLDPLSKALQVAFEGVDLDELEAAWKAAIEDL